MPVHALAEIPDPYAVIQPPRFRTCQCGVDTTNCDGRCDTCVSLESDHFGRVPDAHPITCCGDFQCTYCFPEGM